MEKHTAARSITRTAVTKLINKTETMLTNADLKVEEISDCFDLLTVKENDLNELNAQIFDLTKTEDLEKELTSVDYYKENILLCKNKLNRAKTKLNSTNSESNVTFPINNNIETKSNNIKLPRLIIEQFDGDIIKWPEFWARFKNTIHENNSLSKVEKLSYLKSYLTKDGERVISGNTL